MKIIFLSSVLIMATQSFASDVCWKKSYGRGAGQVPQMCDPLSLAKSGLLCYAKPKEPGWFVVAGIAQPPCPEGDFRDDGLTCWKLKAGYGRGAGYPWMWGDGLSLESARNRCAKDNPQGCEQDGLIVYPKCKPGYHAFGCCICTPDCPAGMTDRGGHCEKPTYVTKPITPSCDATQEYDAGLCYNKCDVGYYGIGPICWGTCPKDKPIDCGAMCGISSLSCAFAVGDMVLSVGQVVADVTSAIATFGTSAAAQGAKAAARASAASALKSLAKKTGENLGAKFLSMSKEEKKSTAKGDFKKKYPDMDPELADQLGEFIAETAEEPEKFDYVGFLIDVEPTGIGKAIKSFMHEICELGPLPPKTTQTNKSLDDILNVCNLIENSKLYNNLIKQPEKQWSSKQQDDFYYLVRGINPIRRQVLFYFSVDDKLKLLKMNCDVIRKDPQFIKIATTPWDRWTEQHRNTAITIIAKGTNIPAKPTLQRLNSFELYGLLRGNLDAAKITDICEVMEAEPDFKVLSSWRPPARNFDREKAMKIINSVFSAKIIGESKWSELELYKILKMNCDSIKQDPAYLGLITTAPQNWSTDQRGQAIKIIENNLVPESSHSMKLGHLKNEELLEFLRYRKK